MTATEKMNKINNTQGNYKSSSQGQQLNYNFHNSNSNTHIKEGNRNGSIGSNGMNAVKNGPNRQQLANLNSNFALNSQ